MKRFTWNEDTLEYFRELKAEGDYNKLKQEVWEFVSYSCHLEDGETYKDLFDDLFKQIHENPYCFEFVYNNGEVFHMLYHKAEFDNTMFQMLIESELDFQNVKEFTITKEY